MSFDLFLAIAVGSFALFVALMIVLAQLDGERDEHLD